ncbi:MAG: DNA mismatch repair protein, partial [Bacteroidia bacterium]|nr:DNA mismatch repair protein [Bacteroidia bacterium]
YDLDFFGPHSLFHNLNRAGTFAGKKKLAENLLFLNTSNEIKARQRAIEELAKKTEWRQHFLAIARLSKDSKESCEQLIAWAEKKETKVSKFLMVLAFVLPALMALSFILSLVLNNGYLSGIASDLFLINVFILFTQFKKIKAEVGKAERIDEIVKQYSKIIKHIENENFESEKLSDLKKDLVQDEIPASKHIKKLSDLFSGLGNIQNGIGAVLLNGLYLFHLHNLNSLYNWKIKHAQKIKNWMNVFAEFEALNSLANFSYNNPAFVFPQLNDKHAIEIKNCGHPLIAADKRVCNDCEFTNNRFIILTGSNMSGKSTFLRTLGINMILTGTGSVVCATEANIHPLNVLVSMRLADSLTESESYFFAEVKRLKEIMDRLSQQVCFVILDEILRGTNSDDKRSGTIEVVKKIIEKGAIGAIATHDLEVCKTTDEYPTILSNKCFEVEIINDELVFDYKLRNGICQNKSATFLMKKMGII